MKRFSHSRGGYVGLIVLLIAVFISVFIMVNEFEVFGLGQLKNNATTTSGRATSDTITPIQQAKDVKKTIEDYNQNLLDQ